MGVFSLDNSSSSSNMDSNISKCRYSSRFMIRIGIDYRRYRIRGWGCRCRRRRVGNDRIGRCI